MAKEGRDERGRFIKGHSGNPDQRFSGERAQEAGRRSQEVQAEARVRNGIIAQALARALMGKNPNTGNRMLDDLIEKTIERTLDRGCAADLRTLADVLGELEQKVEVSGDVNFNFKFGDQ